MNTSGVYRITNLVNGKSYVGSSKSIPRRWGYHMMRLNNGTHANPHLQRSWSKHGEENFAFTILERTNGLNGIVGREQHWIDKLKPEFNIRQVAQSNHGMKYSDETRKKMSQSHKARWSKIPKDERLGILKHNLEAARQANIGKHRTPEQKAHLSQCMKNRVFTDTHRRRITEGNKRAWANPESKAKRLSKARSLTKEQVFQLLESHDLGESKHSLAEQYGISRRMVSYIVNGKSYSEHVNEYRMR